MGSWISFRGSGQPHYSCWRVTTLLPSTRNTFLTTVLRIHWRGVAESPNQMSIQVTRLRFVTQSIVHCDNAHFVCNRCMDPFFGRRPHHQRRPPHHVSHKYSVSPSSAVHLVRFNGRIRTPPDLSRAAPAPYSCPHLSRSSYDHHRPPTERDRRHSAVAVQSHTLFLTSPRTSRHTIEVASPSKSIHDITLCPALCRYRLLDTPPRIGSVTPENGHQSPLCCQPDDSGEHSHRMKTVARGIH
ncbi:MAG: hypothetical protein JWM95_5335 [Gemmatimonadetes bacterium]|nr:hypothetical protein [Gemmatimonadota bacterium]